MFNKKTLTMNKTKLPADKLAAMFEFEELEARLEMAPWKKKCKNGCPTWIVAPGPGEGVPCMVDGCGITGEHSLSTHFTGDGYEGMTIREIIEGTGLTVNEGTVKYLEAIFEETPAK